MGFSIYWDVVVDLVEYPHNETVAKTYRNPFLCVDSGCHMTVKK